MPTHIAVPGDSFATIARDHGFDRDALYTHPDNAQLRKKRPDPNVIHPGDEVALPDKGPPKRAPAQVEKRNRFVVTLPRRELRLTLLDVEGKPIADEPYWFQVGNRLENGRTDGAGGIVQTFGGRDRSGELIVRGKKLALDFGALNPVDEVPDDGVSGARERLRNLGYDVGDPFGDDVGDDGLDGGTRTALALFQRHAAIDVTGKLDDTTLAKLASLHGC